MQPFTQGTAFGRRRRNFFRLPHYTRKTPHFARGLRLLVSLACFAAVFASYARAAPPEDVSGVIAAFAAERDALITDPKATADDYRTLQTRYAARLPLETLTAPELAQSAAAGIWDFPDGRARAAARLSALPDDALTSAIRLQLDGAVTPDQTPDPSRQKTLLAALLARPDLPDLMRSANARYAVNALCGVGRSAVLSERGTDIAAAIAGLDPAQSPEIAADAGRVALLLTLALPDPAPRRAALEKLLIFVRAAQPHEQKRKEIVERQILRLQDVLRQTTGGKGAAPGRFTLPTIYDMLRADAPFYEPLTARSRFYPSEECLLPLSKDALYPRRDTRTAARDAVIAPLGENGLRAFGGVSVKDNLFGFTADDIGILPETRNGFAKNALIRFGPYDLRADFLRFGDDGAGEITNAGFYGLYRGRGWTKLETSRISLSKEREIKVEGVRLSLLNVRLLTIKEVKTKLPEPKPEHAAPKTPSGPKGQSPITQLLVLPTVGFESGGLTVGYGNAFKFARRLTVPFHFRFYAKDATSFDIGLNYNFLKITNNADRFTEADYLQEKYLGSYYFDALNDAPLDENERLFVPSLFAGVYTARNQYYVDKDSIRRAINVPFKAAIEGSCGIGNLLGGRLQLSRERVTDEGQGADSRWQLMGIVGPPSVRVFRGTHLFLRGEGISRNGETGTYTWLRGLAGVTARLTPEFRLSAAYIHSIERGKPQFTYDEVTADTGYAVRGDFALGTIRLYAMDQYSQRDHRWVRFQIYLSEVIGVLEPYIRIDQRFGSVSVGLRTPIDAFLDQFLRRRYTRIE